MNKRQLAQTDPTAYSSVRARLFARALAMLGTEPTLDDVDVQAVLSLITEHRITRNDFTELDERPAQFGSSYGSYQIEGREWHFKLRQVRNRHTQRLFDAMAASEAALAAQGEA